jgi:hypothetical protein
LLASKRSVATHCWLAHTFTMIYVERISIIVVWTEDLVRKKATICVLRFASAATSR